MPHTHAPTKAAACHDALEAFEQEHHHAPDAHEKARLLSDAVKEWEHEEVAASHPAAHGDRPAAGCREQFGGPDRRDPVTDTRSTEDGII